MDVNEFKDATKYGFKQLYKRAKTGKMQLWSCWVEWAEDKGEMFPCLMRESGQQNGKMTIKKKFIKKGKNIGKSNEQTPMDVALFQAGNAIKSKVEENMVDCFTAIDDDPKYLYPALAIGHNPNKTQKLLASRGYLYVQPKLNGARCWNVRHLPKGHNHTETPEFRMTSRKLKTFDAIKWMENEVERLFDNVTPDGEIFNPDWDFQTIISFLKKYYKAGENTDYPALCTEDLQYHVYDIAEPDMVYEDRKQWIEEHIPEDHPFIVQVPTHKVTTLEEIDKWNEHYILLGYEGLIIRDPESEYAFCDRNDSLIKYKKFYDAEFPIVDFTHEIWDDVLTNRMRKLIIFICETESGIRFNSRPKGSFLMRERMFHAGRASIGKNLTVRYQELSQDGVPIMNIGNTKDIENDIIEAEAVRDYE